MEKWGFLNSDLHTKVGYTENLLGPDNIIEFLKPFMNIVVKN